MTTCIFIYLGVIIIHALVRVYLSRRYFSLTPVDRIKRGYLKWSENFKYQNQTWILNSEVSDLRQIEKVHYRIDIHLIGLYRCLFNKPLLFKDELRKLNSFISDVNSIDPNSYFWAKKRGKVFF